MFSEWTSCSRRLQYVHSENMCHFCPLSYFPLFSLKLICNNDFIELWPLTNYFQTCMYTINCSNEFCYFFRQKNLRLPVTMTRWQSAGGRGTRQTATRSQTSTQKLYSWATKPSANWVTSVSQIYQFNLFHLKLDYMDYITTRTTPLHKYYCHKMAILYLNIYSRHSWHVACDYK